MKIINVTKFTKRKLFFACGIVALFKSQFCLAYGGKGNGADAVVCNVGVNETIELLDHYEASTTNQLPTENRWGRRTWPDNTTLERKEINKKVVASVKKIDRYRGELLEIFFEKAELDLFDIKEGRPGRNRLISFSKSPLKDVKDEGDIISIPENCEIQQLVYRKRNPSFNQTKLIIYENYFDQLSPEEQSMTLAHEFAYGLALEHGALNSLQARLMNGLYYSGHILCLNAASYFEYLKNSPEEDLRTQFPYVVNFGGKIFPVYSVYINIGVSEGLHYSFGINPVGRYIITETGKENGEVNYSTLRAKGVQENKRAPISLDTIYEYRDGHKKATGTVFNKSVSKIIADNGIINFLKKKKAKNCYTQIRVSEDISSKDNQSIQLERILRSPLDQKCLEITIDGKQYKDSEIVFPIDVKNNTLSFVNNTSGYDSDE